MAAAMITTQSDYDIIHIQNHIKVKGAEKKYPRLQILCILPSGARGASKVYIL